MRYHQLEVGAGTSLSQAPIIHGFATSSARALGFRMAEGKPGGRASLGRRVNRHAGTQQRPVGEPLPAPRSHPGCVSVSGIESDCEELQLSPSLHFTAHITRCLLTSEGETNPRGQ